MSIKTYKNYMIEIGASGFTKVMKDGEKLATLITEEESRRFIFKDSGAEHYLSGQDFVSLAPVKTVVIESGDEYYAAMRNKVESYWVDKDGNQIEVCHADGSQATVEDFLAAAKFKDISIFSEDTEAKLFNDGNKP